jgi:hypothetical protein
LTKTKNATDDPESAETLAWLLVVDSLIFQAEAEVRWLDHCVTYVVRAEPPAPFPPAEAPAGTGPASTGPASTDEEARR